MAAASWCFGRPIRAAARARREIESRLQSHVQQTLTGIQVVQAFAQEDDEQRRFQELASGRSARISAARWWAAPTAWARG